jgi:Arc/MetJ-type ribon-helix-helix transcriptional regulator
MNRTTVVLPDNLKAQAMKTAQAKGISFGELVREAIEKLLATSGEDASQRSRRQAIAAMLQFAETAPAGPADLSERLDDYLYGKPSKKSPA